MLETNNCGSIMCVKIIEELHPGYFHSLYQYATSTLLYQYAISTLDDKAGFASLSVRTNEQSETMGDRLNAINIHEQQLNLWF